MPEPRRSRRTALFACVCLIVSRTGYAGVSPKQPTLLLDPSGARLSAHLEDRSLADTLNELSRLTGAQVLGFSHKIDRPTAAHFEDVPLGEGIARLLAGVSFALVLKGSHTSRPVKRIIIFGAPGAVDPSSKPGSHGVMSPPWEPSRRPNGGSESWAPAPPAPLDTREIPAVDGGATDETMEPALTGLLHLIRESPENAIELLGLALEDPDPMLRIVADEMLAERLGQTMPPEE